MHVLRKQPVLRGCQEHAGGVVLLQFYTVKDALDRPYKVLRHSINAAAGSTDDVVFEEPDEVCVCGGGAVRVCFLGGGGNSTLCGGSTRAAGELGK
jgi:hypothetical protein